jgi:hypothetical protein
LRGPGSFDTTDIDNNIFASLGADRVVIVKDGTRAEWNDTNERIVADHIKGCNQI